MSAADWTECPAWCTDCTGLGLLALETSGSAVDSVIAFDHAGPVVAHSATFPSDVVGGPVLVYEHVSEDGEIAERGIDVRHSVEDMTSADARALAVALVEAADALDGDAGQVAQVADVGAGDLAALASRIGVRFGIPVGSVLEVMYEQVESDAFEAIIGGEGL